MISIKMPLFSRVWDDLREVLVSAPEVEQVRWQGVDVSRDPSARCYEVRNVALEVPLQGIEDLDHWRQDIAPNLPWADDHFLERVGGQPLNPGVEWRNWPWGASANRFRKELPEEIGPRFPAQDWAYLAAMIDGEGSIYYKKHTQPTFQGRINVGQKDRRVLDWIRDNFRVGRIFPMPSRKINIRGKDYDHDCHMWEVNSMCDVKWIATGCLPYFRVKKGKAEQILGAIQECELVNGPSKKSHKRKVWDRDWPARFNHSYMERFWPKVLDGGSTVEGHRRPYGDLNDLVDLLVKDPWTRQAYLPLFFPEDTGWQDGGRKMCSLGYQFLRRGYDLHLWYPLRSCDLVHHFRDDCYLAVRLLLWVLDRCRERDPAEWSSVRPGDYSMWITSLHMFEASRRYL